MEIRIPLSAFDKTNISFTYPDSLISLLLADRPKWEHYRRPHHGKVFTMAQIVDVIAENGMPNEDDPVSIETGERLVEAQIWDRGPLKA